jgi:hypothetical protein
MSDPRRVFSVTEDDLLDLKRLAIARDFDGIKTRLIAIAQQQQQPPPVPEPEPEPAAEPEPQKRKAEDQLLIECSGQIWLSPPGPCYKPGQDQRRKKIKFGDRLYPVCHQCKLARDRYMKKNKPPV